MTHSRAAYSLLDEAKEKDSWNKSEAPSGRSRQRSVKDISIISLLVTSILINIVLLLRSAEQPSSDGQAIQHAQRHWSPILDTQLRFNNVVFDSTLFGDSIYRQNASKEVDQAWNDLGLLTTQIVDEADAERIGFLPGMVKQKKIDGGGFFAQMEVFHQLHCLDTLRQGLYYNFEYYREGRKGIWALTDHVARKHIGHCLDVVRMQLQCAGDTGMAGFTWIKDVSGPFAKFDMEHKCRDFDAIRAYALEHDQKGVPERRPGDIVLDSFP